MHWRLEDLLGLPVEYYEILMEIAPKWLGEGHEGEE
jgi:hypothetical protein